MSDSLNEQVSASVDGELDGTETSLLLRRLSTDPELRARWARYHLISDSLKNNLPQQLPTNLAERVAQAIADQPTPHRLFSPKRLLRPVAGLAIAASVAAFAVLGMRALYPEAGSGAGMQVASAVIVPPVTRVNGTHWDRTQPEVAARLNTYLLNHNGHAETAGMQAVLPYVRIVGYDVAE